jgi:hypothetical protein
MLAAPASNTAAIPTGERKPLKTLRTNLPRFPLLPCRAGYSVRPSRWMSGARTDHIGGPLLI